MSFVKRGLSFVITLGEDQGTFEGGANKLGLQNPRCRVTAQSCIGGDTAFAGSAMIQIWGMKPADMARLSILGFDQGKIGNNSIQVAASDADGNHNVEVFSGGIFSARINYNAMPDVALEIECWATTGLQAQKIDGTSAAGSSDVAALLQGICKACTPPVEFVNHGVTAGLANHAVDGSPAQQIEDICLAAGVCYKVEGNVLTIWPKDQSTDGVVITTGPGLGLVGFPEYNAYGIDVTMEFNPEVQLGRQLTINSTEEAGDAIPGLPGTYWINVVAHDLSCELPGGPWFTHASLSNQQIVGRA